MNQNEPIQVLQRFWGFPAFRGEQEAIINAVLANKDALALLPTGGGKSICYQVPALLLDGLCLVVSPLIALMKDQVENLQRRNIPAAALHSGMSYFEVRRCLQQAAGGEFKILYLSPERLQTKLFVEYLPALHISLLAVDEAHCISQWGYDFRPPYLRIAETREELPGVPVLAVTASATPLVQQDIIDKLRFKDAAVYVQSFERPNISYSVFNVDSKINKLVEILNNVPGSSIVYCRNRRQTQQVAELLRLQGFGAEHYHAGLNQSLRSEKQDNWIRGNTRVIVCTNAFGMGIDKPDVRTVIHYDLPDSIENYYQEAGRAGRDGKKAYAVAVYQRQDSDEMQALPELRFPSFADIKRVYQALADYLDIPVGLGQGNYYDFDIAEFARNFKLDLHLVMNVLKALEHEGHLAFNENIFLPTQVCFRAEKTLLEDFESGHPKLEPLMKLLLRSYEGIYDNRVSVNEKFLARLLRTDINSVQQQLQQLAAYGIIEYLPQKETPQLYFLLNRAPAEYITLDHEAYNQRKQQYKKRIHAMLQYLQLETCRSRYIAGYFGQTTEAGCGVCDNCLRNKSVEISEAEFREIQEKITTQVPAQGIEVNDLLKALNGVGKDKLWKVLEFMQAERKLVVENDQVKIVSFK